MHLAIDALGIKHSGGATVLLDFLNAVLNDPRVTQVTIFCSPRITRRFDLPQSPRLHGEERQFAEKSYLARVWWFQVLLARHCHQAGADALICMVGAGHAQPGIPYVTFIQQSLPFSVEAQRRLGFSDRAIVLVIKLLMKSSCRSAQRVIVQTPTMRRWVSEQFRVPIARIDAVIPAIDTKLFPLQASAESYPGLSKTPNILYVGNLAPYKNIETILVGMKLLQEQVPEATLCATCSPDQMIGQQPGIRCLGFLPADLLAQVYREAAILVMPSLVETVGLPMLEAMSAGVPVLAADRPYAHDICGDAALFFDPLSAEDFARSAKLLLRDHELRRHLTENGKTLIKRRAQEMPYAKMVDIVLKTIDQKPTIE